MKKKVNSKMKNDKEKFSYLLAEHRSCLNECLETEKLISRKTGIRLIETQIYVYYGFDKSINCYRYILKDLFNDLGLPTWLHVYKRRQYV